MSDESSRSRRLIAFAFPAMVGTRVLGAALSPFLFAHAPIVLILMSPFLVHLVVVGPLVGPAVRGGSPRVGTLCVKLGASRI